MADSGTIAGRLAAVQERIAEACKDAGRSPDEVTLVAVSKTHPLATIEAAWDAGILDFGENRPEEAYEKILAYEKSDHAPVRWHMVGHVQSRKARLVAGRFDLVHSLDGLKLANKLSRLAQEQGLVQEVLLEVNVSGEQAKYGWAVSGWQDSRSVRESLWNDIRSILSLPGLQVRGLMTMAPVVPHMELARPVFADLRDLREALRADFPQAGWSILSMGMSDDYPVAIAEGATHVRIGRAIFGPR